jgi:hypothetical protein
MFERLEIVDEQGREWIYVYESEEAANSGQMWLSKYIRMYNYTKTQFRARFTAQELIGIEVDLLTTTDVVRKATLIVIKDELMSAPDVDVTHPATLFGINKLVEFGLLTQERADYILQPPVNTLINNT